MIEPWEEPADQLENFVSQLSGRNREVANNLASLLPQICQKTPCIRTEHDWPKSLDAESTTIQVDWKRLSVGRIRRHPGRFNHSMESHPAAAEIGDACAMPFFLDGADSTTGCLLMPPLFLDLPGLADIVERFYDVTLSMDYVMLVLCQCHRKPSSAFLSSYCA